MKTIMEEDTVKNIRIRTVIVESGISYKAAASAIGCSADNFSRILSVFELADFEQDRIIESIKSGKPIIKQHKNRYYPCRRKNNIYIRESLAKTEVHLAELAKADGISVPTLCRRLRNELPMEEQERYVNLIYKIKEAI